MVSQLCLMGGSTVNCQILCPGARPRYSLDVDEDVKKPANQPTYYGNYDNSCYNDTLRKERELLLLPSSTVYFFTYKNVS